MPGGGLGGGGGGGGELLTLELGRGVTPEIFKLDPWLYHFISLFFGGGGQNLWICYPSVYQNHWNSPKSVILQPTNIAKLEKYVNLRPMNVPKLLKTQIPYWDCTECVFLCTDYDYLMWGGKQFEIHCCVILIIKLQDFTSKLQSYLTVHSKVKICLISKDLVLAINKLDYLCWDQSLSHPYF